jgi:hypothetical protein
MVYVWPLSPSSYDVVLVIVVVTIFVDGETIIVMAYLVDYVWVNICCISCSIVASFVAYSSI